MVAAARPAVAGMGTAVRSGGRDGRRLAAAPVTGDAGSDERVRRGEERVTELVEVWVVLGGGLEQGERAAVAEARASVHGGREPGQRERDGRGHGFYGTGGHDARSSGPK